MTALFRGFVLTSLLATLTTGLAWAGDRAEIGTRGGFSASSLNDPFVQLELYGSWDFPDRPPWRCANSAGWYVKTRLDGSAGWLSGQGEDAFVGTLGPGVAGGRTNFPVTLDFGVCPTILSRTKFGATDFALPLQFTSHFGFAFALGPKVNFVYRFQHMSNAGIGADNPGLNLHMFSIGYRF